MRIVTYSTSDDSIPQGQRCVARIRAHFPASGKRKAGEDWCPIFIYGATEDEARANAQAWWDAEIAKERRKVENAIAAGGRARARAAKELADA